RIPDDAAPDFGFLLDESGGFRRRAPRGMQVDLRKMVLRLRALKHFVHGLVELCNHGGRRLWRRSERVPGPGLEAFHPGFVERRYARQTGNALVGGHREDTRFVRLVKFDRRGKLHENEVDMTGDDIVERGSRALIGTCTSLVPVTRSNSAAVRCDVVPMPCDA